MFISGNGKTRSRESILSLIRAQKDASRYRDPMPLFFERYGIRAAE
jgi:hypothetical protein